MSEPTLIDEFLNYLRFERHFSPYMLNCGADRRAVQKLLCTQPSFPGSPTVPPVGLHPRPCVAKGASVLKVSPFTSALRTHGSGATVKPASSTITKAYLNPPMGSCFEDPDRGNPSSLAGTVEIFTDTSLVQGVFKGTECWPDGRLDSDNGTVVYSWRQIEREAVALSQNDQPLFSFIAPPPSDETDVLQFQLIVQLIGYSEGKPVPVKNAEDTVKFVVVGRDFGGDGLTGKRDNCSRVANPDQSDTDGDGVGDARDNYPNTTNRNQDDGDADGTGDACDLYPDDSNDYRSHRVSLSNPGVWLIFVTFHRAGAYTPTLSGDMNSGQVAEPCEKQTVWVVPTGVRQTDHVRILTLAAPMNVNLFPRCCRRTLSFSSVFREDTNLTVVFVSHNNTISTISCLWDSIPFCRMVFLSACFRETNIRHSLSARQFGLSKGTRSPRTGCHFGGMGK